MLIIAGDEESEKICSSVNKGPAGHLLACTCIDSCEGAWKLISFNPYRFGILMIGSGITDHAGREDAGYLQRIYSRNPRVLIAICTAKQFLPYDIFSIPSFFTIKAPVHSADIEAMLDRASMIERIRNGRRGALIPAYSGCEIRMIPAGAVIYAKKIRNGITLVTECGEIMHRRKMDEFERFAGSTFFRCHTSYIVNIIHVVEITGDSIKLDNGEYLPVSRSYQNQVHRYLDFYNISAVGSMK